MKTSDSVLALVASMERARQRGTDDETAARIDHAKALGRKLIDEIYVAVRGGMSTEDALEIITDVLGILVKHSTTNEGAATIGLVELFGVALGAATESKD